MRKKYLSALLFGALLFASAGTFTSCKDYDDDINGLRTEITDLKSAITELQNAVQKGKYVTAVSGNGNVITFTFSDGSTTPITVETESGEASQTVTIGEDGELIINGEGTGYYATTEPTEAEVETGLTKQQNGTWWVLGENGEYTDTKIPVSGISVSGSEAEGYTFTVYDATGTPTTVELPSVASAITSIRMDGFEKVFEISSAKFNLSDKSTGVIKKAEDWKGNKALPANGSFVYASPTSIDVRIDPVSVDVTSLSFYLTNTKNNDLEPVVLNADASQQDYESPMTGSTIGTRAAVTGNGLWTLSMDNTVVTEAQNGAIVQELAQATNNDDVSTNNSSNTNSKWAYALNAAHASRSEYGVTVEIVSPKQLTSYYLQQGSTQTRNITIATEPQVGPTSNKFKVGSPVTVGTVESSALYDMYLEASPTDVETYGLTFDQDNHTFTIGKNPDVSSLQADFDLTIWTIDNTGMSWKNIITVSIDSEISAAAEYELQTHPVNHDDINDNHFGIDLSIMKQNLGAEGLQKWEQNVNLSLTSFDGIYTDAACTDQVSANGFEANVVEKLDKNNKVSSDVTEVAKANFIQVDVDNANVAGLELNKTYYFQFTFKASANENLKTIVVPVQFTAPTLAEQFVKETAVFTSNGNTAWAYMNVDDQYNTGANRNMGFAAYKFSRAFKSMPLNAGVTFELSADKDLLDNKKSSQDLAKLGTDEGTANATTPQSIDNGLKIYLRNDAGLMDDGTDRQIGYGQELTIIAKDSRYGVATGTNGWVYANNGKDGEYTFKIKVLSPIFEGTVTGTSTVVNIEATDDGYKITNEDIQGATYNNISYAVLPDKLGTGATANSVSVPAWKRPEIQEVTAESQSNNVVAIGNNGVAVGATADKDVKLAEEGYIRLLPQNTQETTDVIVEVTVEDIWGYKMTSPITVRVNSVVDPE